MSKYWFKAKRYGWGWYPASWQGWLVLAAYIGVVLWFAKDVQEDDSFGEVFKKLLLPQAIATAVLIYISYKKGEKPRWRWGK